MTSAREYGARKGYMAGVAALALATPAMLIAYALDAGAILYSLYRFGRC